MSTQVLSSTKPTVSTKVAAATQTTSRFLYIDNIRAFLTVLVLLHHIMIIYSGSGGWIYHEGRQDTLTEVIGSMFTTVNQAYFMGLFLLISAYFVPGAFDRKGTARFWKDRLIRLGIPLVLYSWVIQPLFVYWYLQTTEGLRLPFWIYFTRQYTSYGEWIGGGPMWFVEALLIFSLVYTAGRWLLRNRPAILSAQSAFPTNRSLALFALLMGLAGFIVRLKFPMGWKFPPLNLQFPYFAQYIIMFAAGLLVYRRSWLEKLPEATGRFWMKIVGLVLLLYFPGAILGGALESDVPFLGGWTWQSMFYSLWEAYLCLGISISILVLFRRYANRQGVVSAFLSRNAYGAYIMQAPVITATALALSSLPYHPLLKFILTGLIAVPLCFGVSRLLRMLPFADRVL